MPQLPRNASFLSICSAALAPRRREPYPFLFTTYRNVRVTSCSVGAPHHPGTWLLDDDACPCLGVGQSITCMPNPDDRPTFFDATLLALRVLECNFVEFYATTYPLDNHSSFCYLRVPIKKARLPLFIRLYQLVARRYLLDTTPHRLPSTSDTRGEPLVRVNGRTEPGLRMTPVREE